MPTPPPDLALAIASAVRAAGGRALIVGGWVRDELLDRTPKDLDLEVFGLPVDRLRPLLEGFGQVEAVGESFAVYKIGDLDVPDPGKFTQLLTGLRPTDRAFATRHTAFLRRLADGLRPVRQRQVAETRR